MSGIASKEMINYLLVLTSLLLECWLQLVTAGEAHDRPFDFDRVFEVLSDDRTRIVLVWVLQRSAHTISGHN